MTKKQFLTLLESAIDGRKGFSIKETGVYTIRLYSDTDIFTSIFIGDVQKHCGKYFDGITVDLDGKPYLSFSI